MVRTVLFFGWMWIVLLLSILLLIPLAVLDLFRLKKIRTRYIRRTTSLWAKHLLFTSGSRISLEGRENVPAEETFCIVANHQSNFDIPLLMAHIPRTIGFIGKREMKRIPFLSTWMNALGCVYIDRKSLRDSIEGLRAAADTMQGGLPMVLFPEGTRSRGKEPGRFHSAGIRLVMDKGIPILPVTIRNSGGMFEKQNRIVPSEVELLVHPLRNDRAYSPDALEELKQRILSPLRENA